MAKFTASRFLDNPKVMSLMPVQMCQRINTLEIRCLVRGKPDTLARVEKSGDKCLNRHEGRQNVLRISSVVQCVLLEFIA